MHGFLTPWIDSWRIDLRSLALFRVTLGGLLLFDALHRLASVDIFLSDAGIYPSALFLRDAPGWMWSIHHWTGGTSWPALLLALQALAATGFIIGFKTRWMALIGWILLVSVQHRFRQILQGSDVLMSGLLFWAIFLPIDRYFAVDAALNRAPRPRTVLSVAGVALLLQAAYVYVIGAAIKLHPDWSAEWLGRYDAVFLATHTVNYATHFGLWLGEHFRLTQAITLAVWGLEMFGPFLLFIPYGQPWLRYTVLFALALMHLGFQLTLAIGPFPLTSLCSLMPFLPGHFWDRLIGPRIRPPYRPAPRFYYDPATRFNRKLGLLLREFLLPTLHLIPADSRSDTGFLLTPEKGFLLRDSRGRLWRHRAAILAAWRDSLWAAPFRRMLRRLPLPALPRCPTSRLALRIDRLLPERDHPWRPTVALEIPLAVIAALSFWWNINSIPGFLYPMPPTEQRIIQWLNLDQYWNMFAPNARKSGWFVMRGQKQNGTVMDAWTGKPGVPDRNPPPSIPDHYGGFRWRKWMLWYQFANLREPFGHYLCRKWNAKLPEGEKLTHIRFWFESYGYEAGTYRLRRRPAEAYGAVRCGDNQSGI